MCKACTKGIGMAKRKNSKSKDKNKDQAMNALAAGLGLGTARLVGAVVPIVLPESVSGPTVGYIVGGIQAGVGIYVTAKSKSDSVKAFGVGMTAGGASLLLAPVINPVIDKIVTAILPEEDPNALRISGPSGRYRSTVRRGRAA